MSIGSSGKFGYIARNLEGYMHRQLCVCPRLGILQEKAEEAVNSHFWLPLGVCTAESYMPGNTRTPAKNRELYTLNGTFHGM